MGNFEEDIGLEKKFVKRAKQILGECFFCRDKIADLEQGTDFLIFQLDLPNSIRVAFRLRRFKYLCFKDDFTIRWKRPSGVKTEIDKIMDGQVNYILYGFVDKAEKNIIKYFIGDLRIFREKNLPPIAVKTNTDAKASQLAIYEKKMYGEKFIIEDYEDLIGILIS
jgi:hypothetical protein